MRLAPAAHGRSSCFHWVTRVALLLTAASPGGARGAPIPDLAKTQAGQRVAAWIAAVNSGDDETIERYFTNNVAPEALERRPAKARLAQVRGMRSEIGTMVLRKVVESTDSRVIVVLAVREGFAQFTFEMEPGPPHRVLQISGDSAEDPDLPPPLVLTEAAAVQAIENAVAKAVAADEFSGTVLVAHGGKPLLLDAWGLASIEHHVPNRTDTKYNLGSIDKIFTRLAIGQLVQAGKLSFDDTLGKILPEYPDADARRKVTVRHMLEMTSGIGDFFGERFDAMPKDRFRNNADYMPLVAASPLAFEPGSQRRYSNGGYVVLGAIVEKISGQTYHDYVREHVFVPSGMTSTGAIEADVPVTNVAEGYTRQWGSGTGAMDGPRRINIYSRPARGSAAGGGYSSAEDLLRFSNAVLADLLLSPAYTDWYLTGVEPGSGAPPPRSRGDLGWNGGAPGINSVFYCDLATGYTVIVLGNHDRPAAEQVAKTIRRILSGVIRT
jgi:D-alanyl-D-alanine carboxypeptidase